MIISLLNFKNNNILIIIEFNNEDLLINIIYKIFIKEYNYFILLDKLSNKNIIKKIILIIVIFIIITS